jgi:hypothetical protein
VAALLAGWLDWMRAQGWRRFGLYAGTRDLACRGTGTAASRPAFELVFHFNREARHPNKIVPCKWAGTPNKGSGLRAADGEVKAYTHIGLPVQEMRIPDSVLRITRHKGRGIETEHPAVFPIALPEFLMRAFTDEGDRCSSPSPDPAPRSSRGSARVGASPPSKWRPPMWISRSPRWRMLHPDLPATLDGDGRDYDAIAAVRTEMVDAA